MSTPDQAQLVDQVRQLVDEARQAGQPPPGRPTLMRQTRATDHQVRQALAAVTAEGTAGDTGESPAATSHQPGASPTTSAPPARRQRTASLRQPSPVSRQRRPGDMATRPAVTSAGDQAGDGLVPAHHQPPPATTSLAPATTSTKPDRPPRPWPLLFIGLGAAVAVWGGWVRLGELTGFGPINLLPGLGSGFTLNTAVVLPLSAEFYGAYALRTLLASHVLSVRTRRFAKRSFIASLAVGGGAQIASHVMGAASVPTAPWPVTTLVSCVPVLVLGLATGLATLVKHDTSLAPATTSAGASDHQPIASASPADRQERP